MASTITALSDTALDVLLKAARAAREHAYAPYSAFAVGATVQTGDGRLFNGCNVENAAYGLCNCAERTALFAAIAAGCQRGDFVALAVVTDTDSPASPCGACRQVLAELCDRTLRRGAGQRPVNDGGVLATNAAAWDHPAYSRRLSRLLRAMQ